jgi:hypothetical protein
MKSKNEPPEKLLRGSSPPELLEMKPQVASNELEAEVKSEQPDTSIMNDPRVLSKLDFGSVVHWADGLAKHILQIKLEPNGKYNPRPKSPELEPGGPLEALGFAFRQCKPGDSRETVATILQQLRADYAGEPEQAAALEQLEGSLSRHREEGLGPRDHSFHDVDPLPAEFGGDEILPTLADAYVVLGETRYSWDGYLMRAGLNTIAGDSGSGKTCLAMDLHRRQFLGLAWPDGQPIEEPGRKVVWLMADQRLGQLCDEAKALGVPMESIVLATERGSVTVPLLLSEREHLARLNYLVAQSKPWAVIIDTFTSAMGSGEQSKPEVINPIASCLLEMAITYDVPVILLTHTNDSGGIFGKALGRRAEHQLSLVLSDRNDIKSPRNLHPKRSRRLDQCQSFGVIFDRSGWEYGSPHDEVEDTGRPNATVKPAVGLISALEQEALTLAGLVGDAGFSQSELVESQSDGDAKTGAIKMRVSRAVNNLVGAGKLAERDGRYHLLGAF